jgi:hypothetical protein
MDIVRASHEFYPNDSPHADTSACFQHLTNCDFGFVYQILSYERIHTETQSFKSRQLNRYLSAALNDILRYGPIYLTTSEFDRVLGAILRSYRRFLAVNYFWEAQEGEFWKYHRGRLTELGYPLTRFQLLKAAVALFLQELVNPEQAIRKARRYTIPDSTRAQSGRPRSVSLEAAASADAAPAGTETTGLGLGSGCETKV